MATEQQITDIVYDIKVSEQQVGLYSFFSTGILAWAKILGKTSFEEVLSIASLSMSYSADPNILMGLKYLRSLTAISVNRGVISGSLDLSSQSSLLTCYLYDNDISEIVGIEFLYNLTVLNISGNLLTTIDIYDLSEIKVLDISDNNLVKAIRFTAKTFQKIETFDASGNALSEDSVNFLLRSLANSADYQLNNLGVPLLSYVLLDGGTNATPTGDGLTAANELTALGVPVTVN